MIAAELYAWIETRGLSHRQAAEALALSVHQLRKMLYGVQPIAPQTERIIELLVGRGYSVRPQTRHPPHA